MPTKKTDASTGLLRDANGYGSLPQFNSFTVPAEGFAKGAIVNGNEVAIVQMDEDKAAAELSTDEVAKWNPSTPEGEGWTLALVADGDCGPWAMFIRSAKEKP